MDEDAKGRGEAGGVGGEMSVAKRSSRSGWAGGAERVMGVALPAGRGIRGGMDLSGEGITDFFDFRSQSSVREREGLS